MTTLVLALATIVIAAAIAWAQLLRKKAPAPQVAQERRKPDKRDYTAEEVKQHSEPGDLWLIIDGKVYDLSEYHDIHPGGDAIFNNAGADSSKGFHGDQHPTKVNDMLDDFYLGKLIAT
mmetsp:Transcript_3141/g.9580  ORF Transcript_3141/g.9580 Transcript_3141/m.9580 type:complete len:119 (-) Transcript_3141:509-865(-)|eukprot:CAMPEP_0198727968 /NCGR_PEP_ID=MMETSP1475-20131203/6648_1 /TAXON_ID= ORGANISM="Unidentified sp., Strain CCMP1999" /NCGR_SAMPLE_ID=MMETSP1475 /ASSEMBLY_ACC=CAM_ASM_001111 /LENGTH=118 /DNA_ID=CAMNT_0044490199 /DNA_START=14 /DNA_END=370 /DNA_ORIENTATION=+